MNKEFKILVTGAAGFIGFHLVNKLLEKECKVVGLDNINEYYDVNLKLSRLKEVGIEPVIDNTTLYESNKYSNFKFYKISLEDRERVQKLFEDEGFDIVINLAAQAGVRYSIENPHVYAESNLLGFLNVLEGCRNNKIKHLLYASSSSVYGLNTSFPFSENQPTEHPISLYAATKKANEMMAHSYSHLYNIPTTGLRFFTVYGPWGRPDMAMFLFTKAIIDGEPIKVFNNGEMLRDFTYVDDVIECILRLINKPATVREFCDEMSLDSGSSKAPYQIVNIGNSNPVNLIEYIEALEEALDIEASKIMMPLQPGDVLATHADTSKLFNMVSYNAQIGVKEGVKRFVDWYLSFYKPVL